MPKLSSKVFDPQKHLLQGKENERLARALMALDSCYKDWVITLSFYSAVHYIYSKLSTLEVPHTHEDAKPIILKDCGISVFKIYSNLSDKSRNARYYPILAETYRRSPVVAIDALISLDKLKVELGIKDSILK